MDTFTIPAWVISALAFIAAGSLWLVRPMPRLVRFSIILPLIYFGCIYLWAASTVLDTVTRTVYIRAGLVVLFLPIITNSLMIRSKWHKGKRL
jgi:hypothetical protein